MMFSLRTLFRNRSIRSVCLNYQQICCHSFNIQRHLNTHLILTKLNGKKLSKLSKRFLSAEEMKTKKRLKPYLNVTANDTFKSIAFTDNENQKAFEIIDSNLNQQTFEFSEENPVSVPGSKEILEKFLKINPDDYKDHTIIISELAETMNNLSLKEISLVLQSLIKWPKTDSPFSKLFYRTWSHVDRELENRLNRISFGDNSEILPFLFIGNIFYRLTIANITKFNYLLVRKLSSPDIQLNKTSLLHLMFYANLHRRMDKKSVPFLMKQCETLVKDMNLEEMAVMCLSFFKTETILSDELANIVVFKTLTDISEQTNNIIRAAIIKSLRRSANVRIEPQIKQFVNEIKSLPNNSEMTLSHLLNLTVSIHSYDPQLLSTVFEKLWSDPTAYRIKDIERIFWCFAYFGCDLDKTKLKSICDLLHEKSETTFFVYDYPICLLNLLHYLTVLGFYPRKLIEHCFEPNFLAKIIKYSRMDFQRHLLTINTGLSVEMFDEYKEILLLPEKVYKYYRWTLTSEKSGSDRITKRTTLINSVYMTLKSELKRRVQLCHIFPFKSYPLVVIFDKPNRNFSLNTQTLLKANMFDNCIVIYILDIQDFAVIDTMIKGTIQLELRLLKTMGFKVVAIPWHHLTCFTTSRARRNKIMFEINKIEPNFEI